MTDEYDVAIIGGGPSGATAAHLLAASGAEVLILEKSTFPRFRIGESLLPASLEVFSRLGFEPTEKEHLKKAGAEFYDQPTGRSATYLFADSLAGGVAHAYQVDRAVFDLSLLEGAVGAGATVHQGERVTEVELHGGAGPPVVRTTHGLYRARYVFDATGLDTFFAHRNDSRRRIDTFGLGAVYRHYGDLRASVADELAAHGNIKVVFLNEGWLWGIPLGMGRISVGFVTRRKGLKNEWLDQGVASSEPMRRVLAGSTPEGPHRRLASFSFFNPRSHGSRWSCIGDAACFLDPVFSSGVTFAMVSAAKAVDRLLPALECGREGADELMAPHAAEMRLGYDVFATMINAVYRRRLLPDLFFASEQSPELRRGMTSILAGDIWREDNPFLQMLWRSRLRVELDQV